MIFDPIYYMIISPALLLSFYSTYKVKSTYKKFSQYTTRSGVSGARAAATIMRAEGITDVDIEISNGFLSDHYDPGARVLRLSPDVYHGTSIASVGVAAHEVGHAVQHARGYSPLRLRSAIVPMASFGSGFSWILLMIGMFIASKGLMLAGVILFSAVVLFQIITLPVEFNASSRALKALPSAGILSDDEIQGARKVLSAAALTYVAAAVTAILQLGYFLLRAGVLGNDD